VRVIKLEIK